MTSVIHSSAVFPKATPALLYSFFVDSAQHTAATGMPAKVSRKPGGKWSAFGGMIHGRNLLLVPNRLIVQVWRSAQWKKSDPDSILVVAFEKAAKGTRVELTHVGVPKHDQRGVTKGWPKYYWEPWRKYLSASRKSRNLK